jgi:hypothetical protein
MHDLMCPSVLFELELLPCLFCGCCSIERYDATNEIPVVLDCQIMQEI